MLVKSLRRVPDNEKYLSSPATQILMVCGRGFMLSSSLRRGVLMVKGGVLGGAEIWSGVPRLGGCGVTLPRIFHGFLADGAP